MYRPARRDNRRGDRSSHASHLTGDSRADKLDWAARPSGLAPAEGRGRPPAGGVLAGGFVRAGFMDTPAFLLEGTQTGRQSEAAILGSSPHVRRLDAEVPRHG